MKKALQFLILFSILMMGITHDVEAQRKKKKRKGDVDEYFDDKGSFAQRLWYGADISIRFPRTGLGAGSDTYVGNLFYLGFSPMAGYKITDYFSVGPRVEFNYQAARYEKIPSGTTLPEELKSNSTNIGVGVFARLKFLEAYFIHLEYQRLGESIAVNIVDDKIVSDRIWDDHAYIGAGYNSSFGVVGFNASILWDVTQQFTADNVPIVYRAGLTYKF